MVSTVLTGAATPWPARSPWYTVHELAAGADATAAASAGLAAIPHATPAQARSPAIFPVRTDRVTGWERWHRTPVRIVVASRRRRPCGPAAPTRCRRAAGRVPQTRGTADVR